MVPDEYIKQYPEPQEVLQKILDIVPGTGYLLYQYTKHSNISKEWKFWAMDLMENGLGTPSVIQLAGEDLDMDYIILFETFTIGRDYIDKKEFKQTRKENEVEMDINELRRLEQNHHIPPLAPNLKAAVDQLFKKELKK